jgi:hypothetical protein
LKKGFFDASQKEAKEVQMLSFEEIIQICEDLSRVCDFRHIDEEEELIETLLAMEARGEAQPADCWDGQQAWYVGEWVIVTDATGVYVDKRF